MCSVLMIVLSGQMVWAGGGEIPIDAANLAMLSDVAVRGPVQSLRQEQRIVARGVARSLRQLHGSMVRYEEAPDEAGTDQLSDEFVYDLAAFRFRPALLRAFRLALHGQQLFDAICYQLRDSVDGNLIYAIMADVSYLVQCERELIKLTDDVPRSQNRLKAVVTLLERLEHTTLVLPGRPPEGLPSTALCCEPTPVHIKKRSTSGGGRRRVKRCRR